MKNDNNQISLFDFEETTVAAPEEPPEQQKGIVCPFKTDEKHRWWIGRNTSLCDKSNDCSHCHIEHPAELYSNPIRKRGRCAVFQCKRGKSEYKDRIFKNKCEITGNEWVTKPWSEHEDYNTHQITTPCDFCDLPACENCMFFKEVSDKHPYGCCGSCAHRLYCYSSKYDKSAPLSIKEFLKLASDKRELDGAVVDFTKGPQKKSYQSGCPYFNGYLCNGSSSQTLCKGTETAIKSDIFRAICEKNHELCPIYKKLSTNDKNKESII